MSASKRDSSVCQACGRKKVFGDVANVGEFFRVGIRRCTACGHQTWRGMSWDASATRAKALRAEADIMEACARQRILDAEEMRAAATELESNPVESYARRRAERKAEAT